MSSAFVPNQPTMTFNGLVPQLMPAQPMATFALEESSLIFSVAFFDENGSATVGSGSAWTLSDDQGTIINGRQNVPISGSGSSIVIALSGLDLKREVLRADGTSDNLVRYLKVATVYTSPTTLVPEPIVSEYKFGITPIPVE